MNCFTSTQVSALGALLTGIQAASVPAAVSDSILASGRKFISQVSQVDPDALQIAWAKFNPGRKSTPAFFFRPAGWKDDARLGGIGFLVPRDMPLSANVLVVRMMEAPADAAFFNEPDDVGVLYPAPPGAAMDVSIAVFCGIAGMTGKFVRTKSHQHPETGPIAELLGRGDAARLYDVLNTPIDADELRKTLRYTSIYNRLRICGITTIGQIVQLSERELCRQILQCKPFTGVRYNQFVRYLKDISERTGVPLHLAMTEAELMGWRPGVSPPAPVRTAQQEERLKLWGVLNEGIGNFENLPDEVVGVLATANLHVLGAIVQLTEEKLRGKIGRRNFATFQSWLQAHCLAAGLASGALHFGMTDSEMKGWVYCKGVPVTTGVSTTGAGDDVAGRRFRGRGAVG